MNPAGQLIGVEVSVRNGNFDIGQVKRLLGDIRLTAGRAGNRPLLYDVSTDAKNSSSRWQSIQAQANPYRR